MGVNPYAFNDDFLDDLNNSDEQTNRSDADIEIDGHLISATNRCPRCNHLHDIPGITGLPHDVRVGLRKLLDSVIKDDNKEVYGSLVHINLMGYVRSSFAFIYGRGIYNTSVMNRATIAKLNGNPLDYEVLRKLYQAELMLTALAYQKSFFQILNISSHIDAIRFSHAMSPNSKIYVRSTCEFGIDKIDYLIDVIKKQYTSLAEQNDYIVNESYLQDDIAKFKPQDEFEMNYLLLYLRDKVGEILDDLKRARGRDR